MNANRLSPLIATLASASFGAGSGIGAHAARE
jgi:hypothetical protein